MSGKVIRNVRKGLWFKLGMVLSRPTFFEKSARGIPSSEVTASFYAYLAFNEVPFLNGMLSELMSKEFSKCVGW